MRVIFLGERPGVRVVIALALILSGIALSEIGARSVLARQAQQDA